MKETSLDEWMCALPLCHFLKKQSCPFGEQETCIDWERDISHGLDAAKKKAAKLDK